MWRSVVSRVVRPSLPSRLPFRTAKRFVSARLELPDEVAGTRTKIVRVRGMNVG